MESNHHSELTPPGSRGARVAIIELMATVRITEAELGRDLQAVLERVQQGVEVVVEQDSRPVAVIKAPLIKGRKISEVIASMEASGANAVVDEDFARDVEEGIKAQREPWNPPSWD
jgi:antitoxin (DNA-binding transcriptional repressor) of toxin-antitoxin stability system